jgi:hypothetical protein
MGIESGSPAMLKKLRKSIKPEQVIRAAEYGKDSSIVFSYSLIVNLPEETFADTSMTARLIDKAMSIKKNSFVSEVHKYFAYPETPLSVEMEKRLGVNLLEGISFEQFAKFDLNGYNRKINPLKIDYKKDCLVFHRLLSRVPRQFQFNIKLICHILLRLVGRIRGLMNYYDFPVEIYLTNFVKKLVYTR